MQRYQSHKIVEASKVAAGTGNGALRLGENEPGVIVPVGIGALVGGYYVKYPDGYVSWLPAEAFEAGYNLVQPSSGQSKIAGYRELTADEIDAMNAVKALGPQIEALIDQMRADEVVLDQRWISIGQTHLQQGLMALTRAIAKPTFF